MFDTMPETRSGGRVLGRGSVSGAVLFHAAILFTLVSASVLAHVEPGGSPPLPTIDVFVIVTPTTARLGVEPDAAAPKGHQPPAARPPAVPPESDRQIQPKQVEDLNSPVMPPDPIPAPAIPPANLDPAGHIDPDPTGPEGPIGDDDGTGDRPGRRGIPDGFQDGSGMGPPGKRDPSEVMEIHGDVEAPVLLVRVDPEYPEIARKTRTQGMVILEGIIGIDGRVESLTFTKSIPLLDRAAMEAVGKWIYRPGRQRGFLVRVHVTIRVDFLLH